jgi:hypothetical protein
MYADLEKIEARGKRKKEKSKGFFSPFGNKDEPEPDEVQSSETEEVPIPTPAPPAREPMFPKAKETPPAATPPISKPQPTAPVQEPVAAKPHKPMLAPAPVEPAIPKTQQTHQTAPPITRQTEPAKPAARATEPEPQPKSSWKPLTGGKLNKAEEDLLIYKKWLNKGYKSGVLTKEQCTEMVHGKEIELGLKPPE